MGILAYLLLGLVAGWLASVFMKTNSQQGMMMDIVLGILGGFVGGFLMNLLGASGPTGLNLYSLAVATVGAIVLIWVGRMLKRGT